MKLRLIIIINSLVSLGFIFAAFLGYLMDYDSFSYTLPVSLASLASLLGLALMNNHKKNREFKEFIRQKRNDPEVQKKLQSGSLTYRSSGGRSTADSSLKDRKSGIRWTGASVHGAVPKRNKRRSYLSKNR